MIQTIYLGGGCFWCVEAVFQRVKGVCEVCSGYAGGHTSHPTYEEVCMGQTGHAEVVKVLFDDTVIPLESVLDVFFTIHDPTTLNRQGNDVGTQYRSAIYTTTEGQLHAVAAYIATLIAEGLEPTTEVTPLTQFYQAEDYHQQFFIKNPNQGYCMVSIPPKFNKLRHTDLAVWLQEV